MPELVKPRLIKKLDNVKLLKSSFAIFYFMELWQRVRKISTSVAESQTHLAASLGLRQNTFNGYLNPERQHNLWPFLSRILEVHPEISREWLYFDEGEMLRPKLGPPAATKEYSSITLTPAVPVVGLASCGFEGLQQIMPFAMTASPIVMGPHSFAVLASGDSMIPAGIASGHMCFCDPDQEALPGEAVFLRQKNNHGALKLFLGRGEREGYTAFQGWLPLRDREEKQTPAVMEVLDEYIDCVAPVICIRRRG